MIDCLLCDPDRAAEELDRVIVWEDGHWRVAMPRRGYTSGFGYLEPKRHVPHITDLDGEEAATFGSVIARVASALREAAGARNSCTSTSSAAGSRTCTSTSVHTAMETR